MSNERFAGSPHNRHSVSAVIRDSTTRSSGRAAAQPTPTTSAQRATASGSSHFPHRGARGLMASADEVTKHIRGELSSDRIYLVPLRPFIGIGWLRAFAEKATDPGWRAGTGVSNFLRHQVGEEQVVFPAYRWLITEMFLPHTTALGWIIMVGQLLAGLAILFGVFSNAALLGGLFMNLNFLSAGAVEPSAFYIPIQGLLFLMGAGAVMGVDAWLSRTVHHPLLVAQPVSRRRWPPRARVARAFILLALLVAEYGFVHITDWSPRGSVRDPAVVLVVLASLSGAWAALALLQANLGQHGVVGTTNDDDGTYTLPPLPGEPAFAMNVEQPYRQNPGDGSGGGPGRGSDGNRLTDSGSQHPGQTSPSQSGVYRYTARYGQEWRPDPEP